MSKSAGVRSCLLPPPGWSCSRGTGHQGPCAAREDAEVGHDLNDWEEVVQVAEKHGWIAEENSKILALFLDTQLTELADVRRQLEEQKKAAAAAEPDELPWPCPVRRTVGHFVLGHGGTGVNAPTAQAAEAERCEHCGGPLTSYGWGYGHVLGATCRENLRAEVERLRGELAETKADARKGWIHAEAVYQARVADRGLCEREQDAIRGERDTARAELAKERDECQGLLNELGDARLDRDAARADLEAEVNENLRLRACADGARREAAFNGCTLAATVQERDTLARQLSDRVERDTALAELAAALAGVDRLRDDRQAVRQAEGLDEACEQMEAEVTQLRAELARLRAPVWTEATREAVGKVAREMGTMGAAPENIAWAAVEAYFAALAQGAPPEGER